MPFDLSTAKPVGQSAGGFDISTAKPIEAAVGFDPEIPTPASLSEPNPRAPDAEPPKGVMQAVGDEIQGAGETALASVTGMGARMAGNVAGMAEGVGKENVQRGMKKADQIAEDYTYKPRSQAGLRDTAALGKLLGALPPVMPELAGLGKVPGLSAAAEKAVGADKSALKTAARNKELGTENQARIFAAQEGLQLPAKQANPGLYESLNPRNVFTSSAAQNKKVIKENEPIINEIVRRENSIESGTPMSPALFDEKIKAARAERGELESHDTPFRSNKVYSDSLTQIRHEIADRGELKVRSNPTLSKEYAKMMSDLESIEGQQVTPKKAVKLIDALREQSKDNFEKDGRTSGDLALALAQRKAAAAVEKLIEDNLTAQGEVEKLEKFRKGRVKEGKLYTAKLATDKTTHMVDAAELALLLEADDSMGGAMQTVRKFAKHFPDAVGAGAKNRGDSGVGRMHASPTSVYSYFSLPSAVAKTATPTTISAKQPLTHRAIQQLTRSPLGLPGSGSAGIVGGAQQSASQPEAVE